MVKLFIATCILGIVLYFVLSGADCHASGGTYVRGLFGMECVYHLRK